MTSQPVPGRLQASPGRGTGQVARSPAEGQRTRAAPHRVGGGPADRRRSEAATLRRLLPRLRQGVLTVDRGLRVGLVNGAAVRFLGEGSLDQGDRLPDPWSDFSLPGFVSALFRREAAPSRALVSAPVGGHTCEVIGLPPGPEADNVIVILTDESGHDTPGDRFEHAAGGQRRAGIEETAETVDAQEALGRQGPRREQILPGWIEREFVRLGRLLALAWVQPQRETASPLAVAYHQPSLFGEEPPVPGTPLPGEIAVPAGIVDKVGGLALSVDQHRVLVDGHRVDLTPSEFKLLALLMKSPDHLFTRREIMRHLWRTEYVSDERACDGFVFSLRHKIERDPSRPERIVTVRGFGYKLVPA